MSPATHEGIGLKIQRPTSGVCVAVVKLTCKLFTKKNDKLYCSVLDMLSVIQTHNLKLGKQSIPWNTYWIWEDKPDIIG
jgi:hypothetical protein